MLVANGSLAYAGVSPDSREEGAAVFFGGCRLLGRSEMLRMVGLAFCVSIFAGLEDEIGGGVRLQLARAVAAWRGWAAGFISAHAAINNPRTRLEELGTDTPIRCMSPSDTA